MTIFGKINSIRNTLASLPVDFHSHNLQARAVHEHEEREQALALSPEPYMRREEKPHWVQKQITRLFGASHTCLILQKLPRI